MKRISIITLFVLLIQNSKLGSEAKRQLSYEEELYNEIARPPYRDMFHWGEKADLYDYDDKVRKSLCDDNDESCMDNMVQASPEGDKKTPAQIAKEKILKEKEYEKAMKDGEKQAQIDLKNAGGPHPYGGFLLPTKIDVDDGKGKGKVAQRSKKDKKAKSDEVKPKAAKVAKTKG